MDPLLTGKSLARRSGVMRTPGVSRRTTVLLLRLRFHLVTKRGAEEKTLLAENWQLAAFAGLASSPDWLSEEEAQRLLDLAPDANMSSDVARTHLDRIVGGLDALQRRLEEIVATRGAETLEAHRRVRRATRVTGVTQRVEPKLPVDILGVYVYLPAE